MSKRLTRGNMLVMVIVAALAAVLLLNGVMVEAQQNDGGGRSSDTVIRGGLTVSGKLLALGPVQIGPGGSIGIYNADGDAVARFDEAGNFSTTGVITAAGFSSDDLVRGFETATVQLVGSIAVPTTTITGTAVVDSGAWRLISGNCSLMAVPTTTVASCAVVELAGDIVVNVYKADNTLATVGAPISWFAWVEEE